MSQAVRYPTVEDLKNTKTLIESCLQNYLDQQETIDELHRAEGIDPLFTHLVWQHLEGANRFFFKEYYLRLELMRQIEEFNTLSATVLEAREEAQNSPSYVAQQTAASLTPGNNALFCNGGGTLSALMGNGDGLWNGIPSSQNGNMQACQGMNGVDEFSFSAAEGAPSSSSGFHAPDQNGYTNQLTSSVAPYSTSNNNNNNLGVMEQQHFNMPTSTVDGSDQLLSWSTTVNGVPAGNEVRPSSDHGSGVQNFGNEAAGIPPSSQNFMQ